ncbi:outer membrane beta-barrel protein [Jejudonia soesokkakensis]|uniref:Outer membrane beta-barrel protein n=1 Tax=Jejudonia soesokkakensis TaxID=1323432 RepID=A0ABW2MTY6_9FLAO
MKNLGLLILVLFGSTTMFAQGQFRAGLSGGIPIGDAGDLATFAIAVDLGYLLEITDKLDVGGTVGYSHSFGDTIEAGGEEFDIEDIQFVPIAASGRFEVATSFTLGADVGYAIGIGEVEDGGFYYSPRAQYGVSESIDIVVAFRGITVDQGGWDIISAGVEIGID